MKSLDEQFKMKQGLLYLVAAAALYISTSEHLNFIRDDIETPMRSIAGAIAGFVAFLGYRVEDKSKKNSEEVEEIVKTPAVKKKIARKRAAKKTPKKKTV